ncbi:ATP-dependent DNA helicase [Trichonephila clavipes]|nr:ATP-dependent DNA helicase [Trichonephila clavipes]
MRDTQQSFILRFNCPIESGFTSQKTILEREWPHPPKTTLTAFFLLCQNDAFTKTLLYVDVPRYYTWNVSLKEWKRRVQETPVDGWSGVEAGDVLGRIYIVNVSNFECYCLRMLLNVIQCPTNFLDLKTVDGQELETFRQACEKLGLLEEDNHWDATMEEADKYKVTLSEDILPRFERIDQINNYLCLNEDLRHIEDKIIRISGKKLSDDFSMPTPQRRGELSTNLTKELSYNTALLDTQVSETEPRLLPKQKDIYNKVLQRVELGEAKIRKDRNVALVVASAGIAATLLSGGRTAHSVFKLPLNLAGEETPTCKISKNSDRGALLQQWDFGQTLPVIEKDTAADEINACLKASYLWTKVEKLYLSINMQVQLFSDVESGAYAQKLQEIGGGHLDTDQEAPHQVVLQHIDFCAVQSIAKLPA